VVGLICVLGELLGRRLGSSGHWLSCLAHESVPMSPRACCNHGHHTRPHGYGHALLTARPDIRRVPRVHHTHPTLSRLVYLHVRCRVCLPDISTCPSSSSCTLHPTLQPAPRPAYRCTPHTLLPLPQLSPQTPPLSPGNYLSSLGITTRHDPPRP
jgi:hypothetical protein